MLPCFEFQIRELESKHFFLPSDVACFELGDICVLGWMYLLPTSFAHITSKRVREPGVFQR